MQSYQNYSASIYFSNEGIIIAQQIHQADYTGSVIEEVCNIDINRYNKELHGAGDESLEKLCHQVACLQ